jgi:dihydroorotase
MAPASPEPEYLQKGIKMASRRQFSKCLVAAGAALVASKPLWPNNQSPLPAGQGTGQEYDLLIKGGTVVDPARDLRGPLDVAIKGEKIAELSPNISPDAARKVILASDKLVTPGLVDIHVHVYEGATEGGLNADRYCLGRGVTTVVDAGSAGYPAIAGFRKYIVNASATRIYALLDIGALGTLVGVKDTMENLEWVNPRLTAQAAESNKPIVIGIKARLSKDVAGRNDMEVLKRAREAADAVKLPLMLHVGDTYSPLQTILGMMRKGDIVTHCYTPRPHGIVDEKGKLLAEVKQARERGILFDVGHGMFHFGFDLTQNCLQQGFLPDTISSDLAQRSVNGPTFDFVTTLSKFLVLGLSLDKVIELATIRPANVFNFGLELGTLKPGSVADVSILQLREGSFSFVDCVGKTWIGRHKLVGVASIRNGKVFEPNAV